jgi:hypothetical protein
MKPKFLTFITLVLIFLGVWLVYVTRATLTIEACTEQGSDLFQVYWRKEGGRFTEDASAAVKINEKLSKRTVKIGNLKDIQGIRIDPLRGKGSVKVRRIEITQVGFEPILFDTSDDFQQFIPLREIEKTSYEDNFWTIVSSGNDPYLQRKITPVFSPTGFLVEFIKYLLLFCVISFLLVVTLHYFNLGIKKILEQKEDFPSDGTLLSFFKEYKNIIFLAIALRVLIMPFFAHDDLAAEMWRSFYVLQGKWKFFNSITWLTSVIHCTVVYFIDLIIPHFEQLMPATGISIGFFKFESEKFIEFWGPFASQPKFMIAVFLFKIPYLIFDLLAGWYLCKLVSCGSRRALIYWLFNPISIFSAYMWGRQDIIMVFFLVGSLFYLEEKQTWKSVVFMILATSVKPATIIILPLYVVYMVKAYRIKGSIITSIVLFFLIGILLFPQLKDTLHRLFISEHVQYLVELKFVTHHWSEIIRDRIEIYLYPSLVFIVIFLYSISKKNDFMFFATLSIVSYFCFCYYHPHYMIWMVPFIIYFAIKSNVIVSLFKALSVIYLFYFFVLRGFKLFLPLVNFTINSPFDNFVTSLHKMFVDDLNWAVPQINFFMVTLIFSINICIMGYLIVNRKNLWVDKE